MEQVKIFFDQNVSIKAAYYLEKIINDWLTKMNGNIEITRVLQSASGKASTNQVTISIFYKLKKK